jgi:hypothetical protein
MIKLQLEKLSKLKETFNEKLNNGATESEITSLKDAASSELFALLPDDYLNLLKIVNGFEWNGYIFYGVDDTFLDDKTIKTNGLVNNNINWYENEDNKKYVYLGESELNWYGYDKVTHKYFIFDRPSGRVIKKFEGCVEMLSEMILDSL